MQRRRNPLCMIVYWFRRVRKTHQFLKLAKCIDCRERHENVISVTKKRKKWPKLLMVYAVFMYNHIIRNRGNQYRYCKLSWIVHLLSQNVTEMYVCHCFLPIPKAQRRTARKGKRHAFGRQMQLSAAYRRDRRQRPCGGVTRRGGMFESCFLKKPQNPTDFSTKKPLGRSECDQTSDRSSKIAGQMTNSGGRRFSRRNCRKD